MAATLAALQRSCRATSRCKSRCSGRSEKASATKWAYRSEGANHSRGGKGYQGSNGSKHGIVGKGGKGGKSKGKEKQAAPQKAALILTAGLHLQEEKPAASANSVAIESAEARSIAQLMTQQLQKTIATAVRDQDGSWTKKKCRELLLTIFGEEAVEQKIRSFSGESSSGEKETMEESGGVELPPTPAGSVVDMGEVAKPKRGRPRKGGIFVVVVFTC